MTSGGWVLKEARPIFSMSGDPRPGHGLLGVSDPDVHHLNERWTMFLWAAPTRFSVRIVQAHLPPGVPVSTDS